MPTIFSEPDPLLTEEPPRERPGAMVALGWALATGLYVGALWAVACLATRATFDLDQPFEPISLDDVFPFTAAGAVGGGIVGVLVAVCRRLGTRDRTAFGVGGVVFGTVMSASVPLTVVATRGLLHPLLATSLAMTVIGSVAGLCGHQFTALTAKSDDALTEPRPIALDALLWALVVGLGTGLAWVAAWLAVPAFFDLTEPFALLTLEYFPVFGAIAAGYGGVVGALVGLCHRSGKRGEMALTLGIGGAAFGGLMGASVPLTLTATQGHVSPLLASSFAVVVVGFMAGLCGRLLAPQPAKSDEPPFDDDESVGPTVVVEWLLREGRRPWRVSRPLARVLPVLAVTVGALFGAGFTSSAALLAVGLLGITVAHALYRQEKRLDAIERRCGSGRDTPPSV